MPRWRLYDASLQSLVSSMDLSDNPTGIPYLCRIISYDEGASQVTQLPSHGVMHIADRIFPGSHFFILDRPPPSFSLSFPQPQQSQDVTYWEWLE